ncbi:MAG: hypothetical protein ACI9R8_001625 [Candidatus Paceibacteria bacterium]|jgi:hypothetical protein
MTRNSASKSATMLKLDNIDVEAAIKNVQTLLETVRTILKNADPFFRSEQKESVQRNQLQGHSV